jgi:hypothetical protein
MTPGPGRAVTTAGAVLLSAGGLGLVAWMITGGSALALNSDLEGKCTDGVCGAEYQSDVDTYNAVGNAATGTLVAGAVLAATGTILLIAAPSDRAQAPSPVAARLVLGLTSLGVAGTF